MNHLRNTLESRIIATLKMNPDLSWTEATDWTLRSIGVHTTLPLRTATIGQQRSAVAKQRIEPRADE